MVLSLVLVYIAVSQFRGSGLIAFIKSFLWLLSSITVNLSRRCSGVWLWYLNLQVRGSSVEVILDRYELVYACLVLIRVIVDAVFLGILVCNVALGLVGGFF